MGIRGIPSNYGGFETFAERLATRLVSRGHNVTVYGRANSIRIAERAFEGVKLVILPSISHKYLDTVSHTFLCSLHSLVGRYDVVLICNAANAVFSWIPRLTGAKVVINVDGLERKRKKWNRVAKLYYLVSEWLSTWLPNRIVTDAGVIKDYYWSRYRKESTMIAYGADVVRDPSPEAVRGFGLDAGRYVLYVSRLEPENNAHMVIDAFESVDTSLQLAIVGDAPYAKHYIARLKATKDPRVKFLGFVFGDGYRVLQQNAFCYVQATEVGGTHPALIEAMGFGNCVLALGTPENREVVGDAAIVFESTDDLREKLQEVLDDPTLVDCYRHLAVDRIRGTYGWDRIVEQYERLFYEMMGREPAAPDGGIKRLPGTEETLSESHRD